MHISRYMDHNCKKLADNGSHDNNHHEAVALTSQTHTKQKHTPDNANNTIIQNRAKTKP